MSSLTLNPDPEYKAIGDAIAGLISDIKAGKSALIDAEDAFQALVGSVASLANVAADAKKVDNQVYLLKAILESFEPAVVPAA